MTASSSARSTSARPVVPRPSPARLAVRALAAGAAVAVALLLTGCGGHTTITVVTGSSTPSPSGAGSSAGSTPSASSTALTSPGSVSGGQGVAAVKIVEGKAFCKAFDDLDTTLKGEPKTPAEAAVQLHAAAQALRTHGTPAALATSVADIADDFDMIAGQFEAGAITEKSIAAAMAGIGPEYAQAFADVIKWQIANC